MTTECPREDDVLAAVQTGRWPGRADAALRAHVEACDVCRELVSVAAAFADVDADVLPPPPEATAVWIRAQLRARADATRIAERPVTVGQAVAFAAIVGLLGALVGASSTGLRAALQWAADGIAHLDPRSVPLPTGLWGIAVQHAGVAITIALCLTFAPVLVYWAIRESD